MEIEYRTYEAPSQHSCFSSCLLWLGLLLVVGMGSWLGIIVLRQGWGGIGFPLLIIGPVVLLLGLGMLFSGLASHINRTSLEPPQVQVSSFTLDLGETLHYRVIFAARRSLNLNGLKVEVSCQEWARYQAGTNSRVYKRDLHKEVTEERGVTQLMPGTPVEVEGSYQILPQAPPTFDCSHNKFTWRLIATYDIPRWPDHSITVPLEVRPRLAEGATGVS